VLQKQEIDEAFAAIERERPDALFVSIGPLFTARRVQLATLAVRHMVPMTSGNRQITEVGGLMSYGADIREEMLFVRSSPRARWPTLWRES
jgi:putative tryptophan/tyrosine transport system substrate-binding protein